ATGTALAAGLRGGIRVAAVGPGSAGPACTALPAVPAVTTSTLDAGGAAVGGSGRPAGAALTAVAAGA
ncbi:hypothetical protein, partial [Mycobacterium helveticum]|uniref:hypothetical protein n=1 Tax=Mycobacterium helveticum TaxID=2592811 RepID=UPI001AEF5A5C